MRKLKKFIPLFLTAVIIVMNAKPVGAVLTAGNYAECKAVNCKNSRIEVEYAVRLSWPNPINKCRWVGTATTKWWGSTPYNADCIRQTNSIYIGGIGSISFGSDGIGCEIEGSTVSDVFEVKNDWYVYTKFDYEFKRAIFMTTSDFDVSARVQLGSDFYSLSCGT